MVGEMRDKETTHIGIEASLTGHLVFFDVAYQTVPLKVLPVFWIWGMDPFNFADAILCIMAQRLVRTLCSECKKSYNPSEEEFLELVREYGPEEFERNVNVKYSSDHRAM